MIDEIIRLIQSDDKNTIIIGIDGKSGSGKTTLAQKLAGRIDCNVFHTDDFFLQPHQKAAKRLSSPGENIDHERMKKEIFGGIESGKPFYYCPFSCKTGGFDSAVFVNPKRINIIEGVYSMHPDFYSRYFLKIFLDVSETKQLKRIAKRGGNEKLKMYTDKWIPLENEYFNKLNIKEKCDLIYETEEIL